jgi:hypothetical protein
MRFLRAIAGLIGLAVIAYLSVHMQSCVREARIAHDAELERALETERQRSLRLQKNCELRWPMKKNRYSACLQGTDRYDGSLQKMMYREDF